MINDFIKQKYDFFIEELSDFIKIKSIASEKEQIKLIVKKIESKLKKLNFKTKIVNINNSNPFILAEAGFGEKTLLIYDHYDVMS
jgi:acetylornithine deacetylase/succinyl-diaminopimelate desuccinylase-like protein